MRGTGVAAALPLAAICAVFVWFLYIFLFSFSPLSLVKTGWLGWLNAGNIIKYAVGLALFAVCLLIFSLIGARLRLPAWLQTEGAPLSRRAQTGVFVTIVVFLSAYLLCYYFITEPSGVLFGADLQSFPWRRFPAVLVILTAGGAALALLAFQLRPVDLPRAAEAALYLTAIVLTFYALLYCDMPDVHHGTAYLESIFNVYDGVPYDIYTTGIYGHYALFYAPFLHMFGGSAAALFRLVAFVGAVGTAACAYVACHIISNRFLRVATVYASCLTVVVMRTTNYWQLQPHRVVFPLLLAAYLCAVSKRNAWDVKRLILGFALCAAALVWSTESGLFCVAALIAAWVMHLWQGENRTLKRAWRQYLLLGGGALASAAVAVLVVNVYNLICGGTWIFAVFFFPMLGGGNVSSLSKADLPWGVQVWALVPILFVLLLCYGLYHTAVIRKKGKSFDPFAPVLTAIAVLGLLQYSYYANRAAYFNLDICIHLACLAMAAFADRMYAARGRRAAKTLWGTAGYAVAAVSVVLIGVLASQMAAAPAVFAQRQAAGNFSTERLDERTAQLIEVVPEDYLLLGSGASVLNRQAGRTAIYHYRDISDLPVGGDTVERRIVADAAAYGKVAFYLATGEDWRLMEAVLAGGAYTLVSEGTVGTVPVRCYRIGL